MSEHMPSSIENSSEALERHEEAERTPERHEHVDEQPEVDRPDVKEIKHAVEQHAVSAKEITIGEHEHSPKASTWDDRHKMKSDAYNRTLQKVRKHLGLQERGMSRVIHQPVVETVSDTAAKTVARPYGILGGGIVSLIGSGALLYMAKHYGFRYNFFIFFLLFVAGYLLGLLVELVLGRRLSRRHR